MEFSSPFITPNFMWLSMGKKRINLWFFAFVLFECFSSPQTAKGHPWRVALVCKTAVEGRWEVVPFGLMGGDRNLHSLSSTPPGLTQLPPHCSFLCSCAPAKSSQALHLHFIKPLYFHDASSPLPSTWILGWISLAGYRRPTHTHCCKEDFAKGQQPLSVSAEKKKLTVNGLGSATSALKFVRRSLKQTHLGMVIYPEKQEKKKEKRRKEKEKIFKNCTFLSSFSSKKM